MTQKFYLGLLPWLVFAIVTRAGGQGAAWAGTAALLTAAVLLVGAIRSNSPKVLNVAALGLFAALTIAGIALSGHTELLRYSRTVSAAGLAAVLLGSLRLNPVAAQYTREIVGAGGLESSDSRRGNHVLTVVWGVTALLMAGSHALAAAINTPQAGTLFNWMAPLALALAAVHQTTVRSSQYFDEDSISIEAVAALLDPPARTPASRP